MSGTEVTKSDGAAPQSGPSFAVAFGGGGAGDQDRSRGQGGEQRTAAD